jgi:hypothetical protein
MHGPYSTSDHCVPLPTGHITYRGGLDSIFCVPGDWSATQKLSSDDTIKSFYDKDFGLFLAIYSEQSSKNVAQQ